MIVHLISHGYLQQVVAFMGKHNDLIFYNNIECKTEK